MSKSSHRNKEKLKDLEIDVQIEKNTESVIQPNVSEVEMPDAEELISVDETVADIVTIVNTDQNQDALEESEIEIVEVVEEFEEIPIDEDEININDTIEIEDISPEFIEKVDSLEEEPTIEENYEIQTVVNSDETSDDNKSALKNIQDKSADVIKDVEENVKELQEKSSEFIKDAKEKILQKKSEIEINENISNKLHETANVVSKEASAVYDSTKEKLKHGKEKLENNEGIEKAFDKSKDVTVNLVQFIKRFVKKPIDTIENANISILETSVLATIQAIIVYVVLLIVEPYKFNFVEVAVIMSIAYVMFIALIYIVSYALHTEFNPKYLYKWFATMQMPLVAWSVLGAILFAISYDNDFVFICGTVGSVCSGCLAILSSKKVINVSRDKLVYVIPVVLVAYFGCMLFIIGQLL